MSNFFKDMIAKKSFNEVLIEIEGVDMNELIIVDA